MLSEIPLELRSRCQWVCATEDKIPINPKTGTSASVTDPATWGTFEQATACNTRYVGYVLSATDPYTIIDLDNKLDRPCSLAELEVHEKILNAFPSYTERSASGRGYHIVVRGSLPTGLHRDSVEAYSSSRYMICTGNVVRSLPIVDCQEVLSKLAAEMRRASEIQLEDFDSLLSDEDLLEMAMRADNGAKFNELCIGDWQAMGYPSQSEADFALLSIFAFYTRDNDQVRRLFRMSGLGKREKAHDPRYVDRALRKIRAKQPERVDIAPLLNQVVKEDPPSIAPPYNTQSSHEKKNSEDNFTLPPGLVGEMTSYIYQTSVRPVQEVALCASLALIGGVTGRCYNISGSGLNQYLILLAKTGSGKDGAAAGIDRLLQSTRKVVPMVDQFVGPAMFASGQALVKVLDEKPCFVSILGEFGFTLRQLCDPRANAAVVMLKRVLLDLYSKSGWASILRSSVYSDKEKNTKLVQAPCLTILGESTPEAFYDGLGSSQVAEGLIPRFSIIEYTGPRPPRNINPGQPPDQGLVTRLAELAATCLTKAQNNSCTEVQLSPEASSLMSILDKKADSVINKATSNVEVQLWNRAHLKALKLAALLAVGVNPITPIVTKLEAEWAIDFVQRDVEGVVSRFSDGEVGVGDHRGEGDLRRAIEAFLEMGAAERRTYKVSKSFLTGSVIPYTYLRRRCRLLTSFQLDRRGSVKALRDSLADLVDAAILVKVDPVQTKQSGARCDLYVVGPSW